MKSIAAVVFGIALVAVACGSSDVSRDSFHEALEERTKLPAAEVTCIVDETFDSFDQDAINDLYTSSEPKDLPKGDQERFEKLVEGCVAD